jgi:non-specific serine/threonine protein kinase
MLNSAYFDFHHVGDRYGRLLALSTRLIAETMWGGDLELSARMIGKCEATYTGIGNGPLSFIGDGISSSAETARAALGAERYSAAAASGAQMAWDELAASLARRESQTADASRRAAAPPPSGSEGVLGVLTRREQEIAAQVALGLTNRRIAESLVISERTVDTHVQRILAKLELSNRVQLAALLAGRRE